MPEHEGLIIAIDGPDGSGKSTQVELLSQYLQARSHTVHTTRASGGTEIGERLREVSLSDAPRSAEVDLHIALAMHTANSEDMQERKRRGEVVIVDRSPASMVAYQIFGSALRDKDYGYDETGKMFGLWGIDELFLLSAAQDALDERRRLREKETDYFEQKDPDYHHQVQAGYRYVPEFLASLSLSTIVRVIDADRSIATIQDEIRASIEPLLTD
jgi:dTMP kinase